MIRPVIKFAINDAMREVLRDRLPAEVAESTCGSAGVPDR